MPATLRPPLAARLLAAAALPLLCAAPAHGQATPLPQATDPPLGAAPGFRPALGSAPPFEAAAGWLAPPGRTRLARSQIVDQSTARLRPRFHWGVFGSFIPYWNTPGRMGENFFHADGRAKISGRDVRLGVVHTRQLGIEVGLSYVRKTVTDLYVPYSGFATSGPAPSVTVTTPGSVTMQGLDGHVVIPFKRFGERVQLGALIGGGLAWIPDRPTQLRVEGPPFYADAESTVPLATPPATGGVVREYPGPAGPAFPIVPGTNYGLGEGRWGEVSPIDTYWMLLRGQLAADVLVAPALKLRVAGGFHYPGVQAAGIDVVYMFGTGTRPGDAGRAPASSAGGPIADRPAVIAPSRSFWGVLGGVTPSWWTPRSWGSGFLEPNAPTTLKGRDFRVGLTRGRPIGYEFGVSYVQKAWTDFSIQRGAYPLQFPIPGGGIDATSAQITFSRIEALQMRGTEFHTVIPAARVSERVQIGVLLGAGVATFPDARVIKRIDGPPFVTSATSLVPVTAQPADGGFVVDEDGTYYPVVPGQTGVSIEAGANSSRLSRLDGIMPLLRAQLALDVLLAAPFKVRISGGFNYPGAQAAGVEAVYLFGTGR